MMDNVSNSTRIEPLESRTMMSTYTVSTAGSDQAAGTTAAPFRTLQQAANVVKAGDSVKVLSGTYTGFYLSGKSGTSSAPITFEADKGAVIDAPNTKTADGINLEGASYVVIKGFSVDNSSGKITRAGIRSVSNDHVVLSGNSIDLAGRWGIFSGFSDNILIEGNTASRSKQEHGIYVSNSSDHAIIRGNTIWGNTGSGIHMNGDISMGGDGIISDALVENNVIYDNGKSGGSGINCDCVQDSTFQNNTLYGNHAAGITLYQIDGAQASKNNVITNNTILMASDAKWAVSIRDGSTGNAVYNNILWSDHSYRGSISVASDSLKGFTSDYNVVMERFTANDGDSVQTLSQWRSSTGQDAHSIVAAPSALFVDVAKNDFHLKTESVAVDKGTTLHAPKTDNEGTARPAGGAIDIGADEVGNAAIPTSQPKPAPEPVPTPAPTPAPAATPPSNPAPEPTPAPKPVPTPAPTTGSPDPTPAATTPTSAKRRKFRRTSTSVGSTASAAITWSRNGTAGRLVSGLTGDVSRFEWFTQKSRQYVMRIG